MAHDPRPIGPVGEEELIARLHEHFPHKPSLTSCDIGDDTTILTSTWSLLTSDTMCEGVHFDCSFASHADVSYRCLAANLSDIAAMGGVPGPFTLSLAVPRPGLLATQADALARGLRDCLADHALDESWLVGGDVVRSPGGLVLTITLLGRLRPGAEPLRRNGATPGNHVAVFRPLGSAGAGLGLLQRGASPEGDLAEAHLRPRVDTALGPDLADAGCVAAAMDLSDGLVADLPRLAAASGVAIAVDVERIPYHPALPAAAAALGTSPRELVLSGGEDYTLCVAFAPYALPAVAAVAAKHGLDVHVIGRVSEGTGVSFYEHGQRLDVEHLGFRHF